MYTQDFLSNYYFRNSIRTKLLVNKFFIIFSRFEYALKRVGYLKETLNAQPNWDRFCLETWEEFDHYDKSPELRTIIDELLANPPKKQIQIDRDLSWTDLNFTANDTELKKLVMIIKTVRNNLFHGGKFGERDLDDNERINFLITRCIKVLNLILEIDHNIRRQFCN